MPKFSPKSNNFIFFDLSKYLEDNLHQESIYKYKYKLNDKFLWWQSSQMLLICSANLKLLFVLTSFFPKVFSHRNPGTAAATI